MKLQSFFRNECLLPQQSQFSMVKSISNQFEDLSVRHKMKFTHKNVNLKETIFLS